MRLLIKLGGTLLESRETRRSLAAQISAQRGRGHRVVVVHGGGKRLSRYLSRLDHQSEFRRGLRVTPPEIMDAVLRVLAGSVNRQLVAEFQGAGARAVGLTGIDAGTVRARQMSPDLGLVGKVERVDPALVDLLAGEGYLPVMACVAGGDGASVFNVNADQMAAACGAGWGADLLLFLTDVGGVLESSGAVIPSLTLAGAEGLIDSGVATGGMEAKLRASTEAVRSGVGRVVIADGREAAIIGKLASMNRAGTQLTLD